MYSLNVEEGIRAVEAGDTLLGLHHFEQIPQAEMSALELSYYAYCLACEHNETRRALDLAGEALNRDRNHPLVYLNVGRIYHISGGRRQAIDNFRLGIRIQRHPLLIRQLEKVAPRRSLVLPFCRRSNPLNVLAGKVMAKFF